MFTVYLDEMLYAANCRFALYPALGRGACLALDAHGDLTLKEHYLPAMYSGDAQVWNNPGRLLGATRVVLAPFVAPI